MIEFKYFLHGGLPDGLTLENIKQGMVAKRNKITVEILDKFAKYNMLSNCSTREPLNSFLSKNTSTSVPLNTANLLIVSFWSLKRSATLL